MGDLVRYSELLVQAEQRRTAIGIREDGEPAMWFKGMDPVDRFLAPLSFKFYGVPVIPGEDDEGVLETGDVAHFGKVYELKGMYVAMADIIEAGLAPELVCDGDRRSLRMLCISY